MQPEWTGSATEYLSPAGPGGGLSSPAGMTDPTLQGGALPNMQGAPGPGTLGAVAGAANGGSDVMSQFQQALLLTQRAYGPALRQPKPPPQHGLGWWLGNVASGGMVGLAERDYNAAYNRQVDRDNQAVRAKAAADAIDLTQKQIGLGQLGFKQQLGLANLQARLQGLEYQGQRLELEKLIQDFNMRFKGTHPPILTEEAQAGLEEQGLEQRPAPGFPGRVQLAPVAPGTKVVPAAPGSPLAEAGGVSEQASTGFTRLREEKARAQGLAKEEQEKGKLRAMQNTVGKPVLEQIQKMKDATRILPSGSSTAGLAGSYTGATGLLNRLRLKQQGPGAVEDLNTLRSGDMLTQQLYRLVAVGVATEQDVAPYAARMKNLESKTQEEARNDLSQVEDFVRLRMNMGAGPTEPTAPTGLNLPPGFRVLRKIR